MARATRTASVGFHERRSLGVSASRACGAATVASTHPHLRPALRRSAPSTSRARVGLDAAPTRRRMRGSCETSSVGGQARLNYALEDGPHDMSICSTTFDARRYLDDVTQSHPGTRIRTTRPSPTRARSAACSSIADGYSYSYARVRGRRRDPSASSSTPSTAGPVWTRRLSPHAPSRLSASAGAQYVETVDQAAPERAAHPTTGCPPVGIACDSTSADTWDGLERLSARHDRAARGDDRGLRRATPYRSSRARSSRHALEPVASTLASRRASSDATGGTDEYRSTVLAGDPGADGAFSRRVAATVTTLLPLRVQRGRPICPPGFLPASSRNRSASASPSGCRCSATTSPSGRSRPSAR